MKALPPTNAELRARFLPFWTWATLSAIGLVITLVHNVLFGFSLAPIRTGATPFLASTMLGALYAGSVLTWLKLRKLNGS